MAKARCPLLDLPITNRDLRRSYVECDEWREHVIARLKAQPPKLVVVGMWRLYGPDWGRHTYDAAWMDSITRLVRQLRAMGSQVLVIGPAPDLHTAVPMCLSGHLDDVAACSASPATAVDEAGIARENAATKAGGGHYLDVTQLFCTPVRCPPIVGNTLVYFDDAHLTFQYAQKLSPIIGPSAEEALTSVDGR